MLSPWRDAVKDLAVAVRWPSIEKGLEWLEDQAIVEGGQIQSIQRDAENEARRFSSAASRAFDRKVAREVRESIRLGESGEQWQKRVANVADFERHVGEVIHRTASHRTYYRGQRDALTEFPEVSNRFPYVLYDATLDNRVRKTHAALDQKVARVGSPLHEQMVRRLDEFNCRCSATPLTAKQARQRGIDDDTGAPDSSSQPGRLTWREVRETEDTDSLVKLIERQAERRGTHQNVDMAVAEEMEVLDLDGLTVRVPVEPEGPGSTEIARVNRQSAAETLQNIIRADLPDDVASANRELTFTAQRNKNDGFWEKQYKTPGFTSAATAGGRDREITVFRRRPMSAGTYAHETGHNFAQRLWGDTSPPADSEYGRAHAAEPPVSRYGSNNIAEDFAEAMRVWTQDRQFLRLKFPKKFAALARLIRGSP